MREYNEFVDQVEFWTSLGYVWDDARKLWRKPSWYERNTQRLNKLYWDLLWAASKTMGTPKQDPVIKALGESFSGSIRNALNDSYGRDQ